MIKFLKSSFFIFSVFIASLFHENVIEVSGDFESLNNLLNLNDDVYVEVDKPKEFNNTDVGKSKNTNLLKVYKVIDGDTIDVVFGENKTRVRLLGVDTPESVDPRKKVECFGKEAGAFLKNLIEGKNIVLEKDQSQGDKDRYGRLLRYVYLDNVLVNEKIIKDGFGFEYTYNLPYKFQKEFKLAQSFARENKNGLWADDKCNNIL